jgi:hypothetical protein
MGGLLRDTDGTATANELMHKKAISPETVPPGEEVRKAALKFRAEGQAGNPLP